MSSITPPSYRSRRRAAGSFDIFVSRFSAAVPARVLGHVVVVVLCLAVAYVGRTGAFGKIEGNWSVQKAALHPSAFAGSDGTGPDTLTRPSMTDTLAAAPQRLEITHYVTQPGDTVDGLAGRFDISDNTILWANHLTPGQKLNPGTRLTILPVSGVLYTAQAGDTVPEVAQRFASDAGSIAQFNQISTTAAIAAGTRLVIPGGRLDDVARSTASAPATAQAAKPATQTAASTSTQATPPTVMAPGSDGGVLGATTVIPFKERKSSPRTKPMTPVTYYVVQGDTLSSIAQHFGVSEASIAAASGLSGDEDTLQIHQKLTIPPVPGAIHVVQQGDTLKGIADAYSADMNKIIVANDLKAPFVLQVGQTLVIPGGTVPPPPPGPHTTYTVTEGDSLSGIADAFGVDLQTIIAANGLYGSYVLQPGQQLIIPGGNPANAPSNSTAPSGETYTVQPGDSVSQIADAFGISLSSIIGANDLSDPSTVQPGQKLVIPGVSGDSGSSAPAAQSSQSAPAQQSAPQPAPAPAPQPAPVHHSSGGSGWSIVSVASKYLGVPYVWGGTSPSGFDCSGFVWYVYQRAGMPIPRDMWGQLQSGTRVSRSDLEPGDIVFFAGTYEAGLSHDGIYIGGGRFINAVDYGIGVAVRSLNSSYWSSHYFGATRPW